jgi:hypothetical protein
MDLNINSERRFLKRIKWKIIWQISATDFFIDRNCILKAWHNFNRAVHKGRFLRGGEGLDLSIQMLQDVFCEQPLSRVTLTVDHHTLTLPLYLRIFHNTHSSTLFFPFYTSPHHPLSFQNFLPKTIQTHKPNHRNLSLKIARSNFYRFSR